MKIASIALTCLLVLCFVSAGAAKVLAVPSMRERAAHVGFSIAAYRAIGALELAAAVGLVAALVWWPVGVAAAGGLVLLMLGATIVHTRHGDPLPQFAPAVVAGLICAAYVATLIGAHR
ncbi:DoxX family protein [Nocardia sp. NPDC059764]|uniref:DoxX family protein n=1 Tax=Nocardia sp. NPDC059764 TaxID=3346939 RepID=UPI003653439D